uniref:Uncharacterized protein n=1 Tax=Aegilops tauschii TaxID=37682 RepID=N1R2E2_AEGTA
MGGGSLPLPPMKLTTITWPRAGAAEEREAGRGRLEVSDNTDDRYAIPLRPEGNIKGCHRQQRSTSSSPSGRRWRLNVSPSSADLSFSYSHLIIVTDTATLRIVQLLYFQPVQRQHWWWSSEYANDIRVGTAIIHANRCSFISSRGALQ